MMDIAYALDRLVPGAEYRGSTTANNRAAYDALVWLDARAKPSWDDVVANGEVPERRRYVPKYTILKRLQADGLLAQAFAAFDQLSREKRELWHAAQDIWSEDPDTLALLRAIGADPDVILAP